MTTRAGTPCWSGKLAAVSRVVESRRPHFGLDEQSLPRSVIGARIDGQAVCLTEHEVAVPPITAGSESLGLLIGAVGFEMLD
jgi:hypothetical protein